MRRYTIALANRTARELKQANRPTTGQKAALLWEICSGNQNTLRVDIAERIYKKAGYLPFSGYPLMPVLRAAHRRPNNNGEELLP